MPQPNWTKQQRDCIDAQGGTVLVSAAAGSGKTSVLVQRIIELVTDPGRRVDVDRLLVVTFTNDAAAQMRLKLSDELARLAGDDPGDKHIQRQQMLLAGANICTVHSFCARLLRDHFQQAGLPPNFKVADTADKELLRAQATEDTLEALYGSGDAGFAELAALLSNKSGDGELGDAIQKTHDFLESHFNPGAWIEERLDMLDPKLPVARSIMGRIVLEDIRRSLMSCIGLLRRAAEMAESEPVMAEKYGAAFTADVACTGAALCSLEECGDWDAAAAILTALAPARLSQLRGYEDAAFKEMVQDMRKSAWNKIKALPAMLCGTDQQCRSDIARQRRLTRALFDAADHLSRLYSARKRERGMLDFSDLEHLVLTLLFDGDGKRTPLAAEAGARFHEIMVDEYQDTNEVQDAIFRALSRNGENLFMVGDVKQSIYGFRQAMPQIFIRRRDAYARYDGSRFPATITLGNNFRSREEVTGAVNFVFGQIMSRGLGGVDYSGDERLIASAGYPDAEGRETGLMLVDTAGRDPSETADMAEARVIAKKITETMSSLTVYEKGAYRPAEYGDFCILLRSEKTRASAYAGALRRAGIPVRASLEGGFFRTSEIGWSVSLLRVIDNPAQDVPLLAAMMSPVCGFSPDDMAEIRLYARGGGLFTALRRFVRGGDGGAAIRAAEFLRRIDRLRVLAVTLPADELINRMYEELSLTSIMRAMPGGEQRVANLRLLHDTAAGFEQKGFRGLSAFMRMLDRLERADSRFSAAAVNKTGDAVRIMTIHGSKGLEFPFVFVAGLGKEFNRKGEREKIILHTELGAGMRGQDSERLTKWDTLPFQAVKSVKHISEFAEELRILYVAMTRAREKLFLVVSSDNPVKKCAGLSAAAMCGEARLPSYAVMSAGSLGDLVLMTVMRHPCGGYLRELAGIDDSAVVTDECRWAVSVIPCTDCTEPEGEQQPVHFLPPDQELGKALRRRMEWQYPYAGLSALPAKTAASALSETRDIFDRSFVAAARPAFLSESGLTPAERGTALHTFMQYCDYASAQKDTGAEIRRLTENGFITAEQGDAISVKDVRNFFGSALFARMKSADRCMREVRFTVEIPAVEFGGASVTGAGDEFVIVQGIADCVLEENGELTIIDYKTDRVADIDSLVEKYEPQLRIYAYALSRTLELPIKECLLYSFRLNRTAAV